LPRQRLPLDSPAHGILGDWADRLQLALRREGLAVEVAVGFDEAPAPLPGDDGLGQAYRVLGADRAALVGVAVTFRLRSAAERRRAFELAERALRDEVPAHLGTSLWVAVPDGAGWRTLGQARVGRGRLGSTYVEEREEGPMASVLLDQVIAAVKAALRPSGPDWEADLRTRLRPLLDPGPYRDGDLLTAQALNQLLDRVRRLEDDLKVVRERGPAAPGVQRPTPGEHPK
jgi:hypothetical protein